MVRHGPSNNPSKRELKNLKVYIIYVKTIGIFRKRKTFLEKPIKTRLLMILPEDKFREKSFLNYILKGIFKYSRRRRKIQTNERRRQ